LDGEFVGKKSSTTVKEESKTPNVPNQIPENIFPKSCCCPPMNALTISNDKKFNTDFCQKTIKRERKDSQDSFEIVDLLENMQCEEDKDLFVDEKGSKCFLEKSAKKGEDLHKFEKSSQSTKCAKYPEMEKQLTNLQQRLENLVTFSPTLTASGKCNTEGYYENQCMDEDLKITNVDNHDGWLLKTSQEVNAIQVENNIGSEHDVCTANSAANLIRKAFSPYFKNESRKNWLSK